MLLHAPLVASVALVGFAFEILVEINKNKNSIEN